LIRPRNGRPFLTGSKARIANFKQSRVQPLLVIGGCDMEGSVLSVRLHHGGRQVNSPKAEVVATILANIRERRS